MSVADNIRRLIRDRGLKQCYVAEKSGFKNAVFSNMICGRKRINAHDLIPISRALGVSIEELFKGVL